MKEKIEHLICVLADEFAESELDKPSKIAGIGELAKIVDAYVHLVIVENMRIEERKGD